MRIGITSIPGEDTMREDSEEEELIAKVIYLGATGFYVSVKYAAPQNVMYGYVGVNT